MGFRASLRWKGPIVSVAVVVCLILLALISVVQVSHLHQTATEADHCALCIVMHSTAPVAVIAVIFVLIPFGISIPVATAQPVTHYWYPQLFTRPPPQTLSVPLPL